MIIIDFSKGRLVEWARRANGEYSSLANAYFR
jgi:hypothetical protein